MIRGIGRCALVALALLVGGCAAHSLEVARPEGRAASFLESLKPGHTTRDEVMTRLGAPSMRFENERILSYRLAPNLAVAEWSTGSRWTNVRYDLVLVFDSAGVLERHRLLRVR
jgi:hypothetical protein